MPENRHKEFERALEPLLDGAYRLSFRLTGVQQDAEDLLQEVLIKVYRQQAKFEAAPNPRAWLSRVIYNAFIDGRRRFARRQGHLHLVGSADAAADAGLNTGNPEVGPEGEALRRDDQRILQQALATLEPEWRAVLLMHDAEGYKLHEIHEITGLKLGTIKSRLHRARARPRRRAGRR